MNPLYYILVSKLHAFISPRLAHALMQDFFLSQGRKGVFNVLNKYIIFLYNLSFLKAQGSSLILAKQAVYNKAAFSWTLWETTGRWAYYLFFPNAKIILHYL